jgi:hypothetical protein
MYIVRTSFCSCHMRKFFHLFPLLVRATWFTESAFIPLHLTELPIKNLYRGEDNCVVLNATFYVFSMTECLTCRTMNTNGVVLYTFP